MHRPENFDDPGEARHSEGVHVRAAALLLALVAATAAFAACDVASSRPVAVDPKTVPDPPPSPLPPPPSEPETSGGAAKVEGVEGVEAVNAPARLVFVTVDGVRWEDAFGSDDGAAAAMPNLLRLTSERGVALGRPGCVHEVSASGPNYVSFPGYLEIFTGKRTACTHNYCPPVAEPTFLDDARTSVATPGEVAVFSSWSRIGAAAAKNRRAIVISAGANGLAVPAAKDDARLRALLEEGASRPGFPGSGDYRGDMYTARISLRYLEVARPRVLVIGLGDADEYAHRGDIPGYQRAIRRADDVLGELEGTLHGMGEDGRETAVVVTTDHGRAKGLWTHGGTWPESRRVFVAAFGARIARRGAVCSETPLKLAHVAGAMRSLLLLRRDEDPGPLAAEILAAR